jgi:hypothetical protein
MANKKTDSGLPPEQPKAPGNAKAGQPIRREEFGGDLLPWLDSSKARWTEKIAATFGQQRRAKIGAPDVSDLPDAMNSIIPPVLAHRAPTSAKEPKGGF